MRMKMKNFTEFYGVESMENEIELWRAAWNEKKLNDDDLPEKYKLGNPSPGAQNDCSGPNFILEDNILQAIPSVISSGMYSDDYDDLNGACSTQNCTSSIDAVNYFQTTSQGVEEAVEMANKSSSNNICTPLNLNPDGGNLVQELDQENSRKKIMGVETDYSDEFEWKTTKFFR